MAGPEFGDDLLGTCMLIRKALYGLKSLGYSWRKALSETLSDMGYVKQWPTRMCIGDEVA